MIITRTPFRISFFGGGTDYPVWYKEHKGSVLSATINKYCYLNCRFLPPFFHMRHLIRYSLREETQSVEEISHPAVRECLKFMQINDGVEVVHTGDVPARSGIGSSSSFTVGLLNAFYALKGKMVTKRQLARDAIYVEQHLIKEHVGSQDQVAVAFGGFNRIDFGGDEEFYVSPITVGNDKLDMLQDHLMLFFTGLSRSASDIAAEQISKTKDKKNELKEMMGMVDHAIEILNENPCRFIEFGKLLHESWKLKKSITQLISNGQIDDIYETARRCGAIGGKLLGAGGGGFMLFFAEPDKQKKIKEKLKEYLYVPFRFEKLGTQIILYST